MKKVLIYLGLSLLFVCCNDHPSSDSDSNSITYKSIGRISWYQIRNVTLISKKEEVNSWGYSKRSAYVRDLEDNRIYYIGEIPQEIYDNYFKSAEKGDTIRI